jgi:hypothetical protein
MSTRSAIDASSHWACAARRLVADQRTSAFRAYTGFDGQAGFRRQIRDRWHCRVLLPLGEGILALWAPRAGAAIPTGSIVTAGIRMASQRASFAMAPSKLTMHRRQVKHRSRPFR